MNPDRLDELVDAHLLGELSPQQAEELQQELRTDSDARRLFVQSILLDAHLHRLARSEVDAGAMSGNAAAPRRVMRLRWLAAAAMLLIAIGAAAWFHFARPGPDTLARVSSGTVLVNGQPSDRVPEGATLSVAGSGPATIRLPDGSQATLDPSTRLVVRGRVDGVRQLLRLISGGGQFQVPNGGGQFRIDTPAGSVTVLGTQFTVAIRSPDVLFVSVLTGTVRFDHDGKAFTLSTGQSRLFGPEPSPSTLPAEGIGKVMVKTGAIQAVDANAKSFEVTLPPRPLTFACNGETEITLDGKASTFDEAITVDRNATVTYHKEGEEVRVASKVAVKTGK